MKKHEKHEKNMKMTPSFDVVGDKIIAKNGFCYDFCASGGPVK